MNTAHPGPYAGIPLWLRPITRRPGEVQFGVLEGGPIVSGVTADEARLLARLDGSLPPEALGMVARESGVSKRRWRVLLDLVVRLGLLEPVPARSGTDAPLGGAGRRPAPPHVLVEGDGSLARDLTHLLGHEAARASDALESGLTHPAVVVLVADIAIDPRRGDIWLQRGVPHLPVVTTGARAVVGPLVDGRPRSPCLWCLDLHRSDRDDAWPTVMAQVATVPVDAVASVTAESGHPDHSDSLSRDSPRHESLHPGSIHPESIHPESLHHESLHRERAALTQAGEPGLAQLVAGTVAALVARSVAGDPPPPGVAVEVSLPWPRLDHRRWQPHLRCGRHETLAGRRRGIASARAADRT